MTLCRLDVGGMGVWDLGEETGCAGAGRERERDEDSLMEVLTFLRSLHLMHSLLIESGKNH
jgi:hypothetical protein